MNGCMSFHSNFKPGQPQGNESQPRSGLAQRLIPPSPQEFIRFYTQLSREYDTIFVLTLSSLLNPTTRSALSAAKQFSNHATIDVIDSQTTGIGLGLLVQAAAAAASAGAAPAEIERRMRATIPRIYMLFCIPELTYLAHSGYMDYSQALVGEMMGMLPIFAVEEGRLTPIEKVRTRTTFVRIFSGVHKRIRCSRPYCPGAWREPEHHPHPACAPVRAGDFSRYAF